LFIDKFSKIGDFGERVVAQQNRAGTLTSFEINRAAAFSRRFANANENNDLPPRFSAVWRLPLDERTLSLRRGDQIRDADSQIWTIVETSISQALQLVSCRCFRDFLPDATAEVDLLRPLRSGGFETLATNAPAVVRSQKTSEQNSDVFPASTVVDEIVFWIQLATPALPRDIVVLCDGTRYETESYRRPDALSDWGVLVARKRQGVDATWTRPAQS
ncbi:MAG: hypothetical protein IKY61_03945, partial [Thermoguttaceae bacterium]|nr:hypothetical protein [Thermoguttaceae bacterium]